MKNRVISILVILTLMLSYAAMPGAAAEDDTNQITQSDEISQVILNENYEYAQGLFTALSVFEESDLTPTEYVTRGEVAKYIGRLMQLENQTGQNTYFDDVSTYDETGKIINLLAERNIITKPTDLKFRPDDKITGIEMAVMLIRMLGYDTTVGNYGGFPAGYIAAAQRIGLEIYSSDSPLRFDDMAAMLYEACTTNIYDTDSIIYENDTMYAVNKASDKTYLEVYCKIYYIEDYISDNGITSLIGTSNIAVGNIKIGNQVIKTDKTDCVDLIGENVIAFYQKSDSSSIGTLVYICENKENNEKIVIDAHDLENYTTNSITYTQTKGTKSSSRTINLADKLYCIRNGEAIIRNISSSFDLKTGTLTLSKIGNSGKYNVVKIEEYTDMIIKSIDYQNNTVYPQNTALTNVDFENPDYVKFISSSAETKEVTEQYLDINDCISVYSSKNYVKILVSTKTEDGAISEIAEENGRKYITVNDTEYPLSYYFENPNSLKLGSEYIFRINVFDEIVGISYGKTTSEKSAYLYDVFYSDKNGKLTISMFTEENQHQDFNIAQSVYLDGVKKNERELYNALITDGKVNSQLVIYKSNSLGLITKIDTVDQNGVEYMGMQSKVNYSTSIFYPKYAIHSQTVYYLIPNDLTNRDEFFATIGTIQTFGSVYFYRYDKQKPFVDYVVSRFDKLTVGNDSKNYIPTMVEKITKQTYDDEIVNVIEGYNSGKRVSLVVRDDVDLSSINPGDLIRYTTDFKNRITGFMGSEANGVDYSYNNGIFPGWENNQNNNYDETVFRLTYGYVSDKFSANTVANPGERKYESFIMVGYDDPSDISEFVNFSRNSRVTFFDPNRKKDKVYMGSFDEIETFADCGEDCDRIVVSYNWKLIKEIFVYKKLK